MPLIIYKYTATSPIIKDIFILFTHDLSKEQYVLSEDDMQCAIETCRSILSVLV